MTRRNWLSLSGSKWSTFIFILTMRESTVDLFLEEVATFLVITQEHIVFIRKIPLTSMACSTINDGNRSKIDKKHLKGDFCMSRRLFNRISAEAVSYSEYLRQGHRPCCCGRLGIIPLFKATCALRRFSYGIPSDFSDSLFDISESTAALCLQSFFTAVNDAFGTVYLR